MVRSALLVLVLGAPLALAAPAPLPGPGRQAFARVYGEWVAPNKDCKYGYEGGKLTIHLPAAPTRALGWITEHPGTRLDVTGDFVATVKVSYPLSADVVEWSKLHAASGLLVWAGGKDHVAFHRQHQACGLFDGSRAWDEHFCIEYYRSDTKSMGHQNSYGGPTRDGRPVYLRVERKGSAFACAYSADGKTWRAQQRGKVDLPDRVKVGVYAFQTRGRPITVTFEEFTVTPVRPGKQ